MLPLRDNVPTDGALRDDRADRRERARLVLGADRPGVDVHVFRDGFYGSDLIFFGIILIREIPALWFLGIWMALQAFTGGLFLLHPDAGGGVAFFAHIGGSRSDWRRGFFLSSPAGGRTRRVPVTRRGEDLPPLTLRIRVECRGHAVR
jgi:hypothetical protein